MKKPILLLHGALGAARLFAPLKALLGDRFEVHTPDFSGHGGNPPVAAFSMDLFVQDVLDYLDRNGLEKVDVFGYSMGGYVAALLARDHPDRVSSIITLATKWQWDEATAAKETGMLNTEQIAAKVPQLAAALAERHPNTAWESIVGNTAAMLLDMGRRNPLKPEDYAALKLPVILLLGDRDKMVPLEETVRVYRSLPHARMGMLPGTPHPYEAVDAKLLSILIQHFI